MESSSPPESRKIYMELLQKLQSEPSEDVPPSLEYSMIMDELRRIDRYMEGQFRSIIREQARQRDAIVREKPQFEPSDEYVPKRPKYEHSAEPSDTLKAQEEAVQPPPPEDSIILR
ncbi:uncharacterized protein LOC107621221 [Arachis ipaensis]|uniref:uncharacterized protein LOC107621221 n=1 Tax=Arachis ipaensis TaxID=130454 RepID=UPI0007AF4F30|nr:uncharacterized protein LOC107621221 [Arachis ipaensis]XP_025631344.1 uncharacterized protein LOC112726244 [Arachis hypogaea]QHO22148.1 uncharacterized protein DS421_12g352700 [Arachis hypogaea]